MNVLENSSSGPWAVSCKKNLLENLKELNFFKQLEQLYFVQEVLTAFPLKEMSNTIHNELVSFILNDFDTQAMPFGEGTLAAHLEALLAVEKQDFFNTAEKPSWGI